MNVADYSAVSFVHGRPAAHPIHVKFAQSVAADFQVVDFKLPWHAYGAPAYKRYLSWLVCGILFPHKRKFRVFLTEGLHFPPAILKWTGLLNRKKQKVVGLICDEALYFMFSEFYSASTRLAMLQLLRSYDALICVSELQYVLARNLLGRQVKPLLYKTFNGVSAVRLESLGQLQPPFTSGKIIFIGNGTAAWRAWYKGLDLLFEAFGLAFAQRPDLTLQVIGHWEPDYLASQVEKYCPDAKTAISFTGPVEKLDEYLSDAALYVHAGRGEAFGISVIEAMAAAVPAMVSDWTGAKEAVAKVSPRLIFPLDSGQIAGKILWYMQLSEVKKRELSVRSRQVAQEYTEEKAIGNFQLTFAHMCRDLGI